MFPFDQKETGKIARIDVKGTPVYILFGDHNSGAYLRDIDLPDNPDLVGPVTFEVCHFDGHTVATVYKDDDSPLA
ncbi:MAG: hypothetical protein O2955_19330 [Planctomycetota bacterium]|nr:hypothetical protein [Planctomycetota bacterium]MDA1214667.1 hypothetical protein [Planctomycetota bacterium]